jgi:putative endonuclease
VERRISLEAILRLHRDQQVADLVHGRNNLERRVLEHKRKLIPGFANQYNIHRLVYYEIWNDIRAAIGREKQIKGWLRARKIALIESKNGNWTDLSEGWYGGGPSRSLH